MFNDLFGENSHMPHLRLEHDKSQTTGYNLGMRKGSFATAFDTKEYFERNIRFQNKKNFVPGIISNKNNKNSTTFIRADKKRTEDFDDKVDQYMEQLIKEENDAQTALHRANGFRDKEDEDYEVDSNHGKSLVKFKKDNTQGKTIQEQLNRALK